MRARGKTTVKLLALSRRQRHFLKRLLDEKELSAMSDQDIDTYSIIKINLAKMDRDES